MFKRIDYVKLSGNDPPDQPWLKLRVAHQRQLRQRTINLNTLHEWPCSSCSALVLLLRWNLGLQNCGTITWNTILDSQPPRSKRKGRNRESEEAFCFPLGDASHSQYNSSTYWCFSGWRYRTLTPARPVLISLPCVCALAVNLDTSNAL